MHVGQPFVVMVEDEENIHSTIGSGSQAEKKHSPSGLQKFRKRRWLKFSISADLADLHVSGHGGICFLNKMIDHH